MLAFRSSARLADAYGVAVTGTFVTTTVLLLVVARTRWNWSTKKLIVVSIGFGGLEATFFSGRAVTLTCRRWRFRGGATSPCVLAPRR